MSDLIRAHEANDDAKSGDPNKIHWGKFNMIGRFITSTTQCQAQCRSTNDYDFPERGHISNLLLTKYTMNDEVCSLLAILFLILLMSSFRCKSRGLRRQITIMMMLRLLPPLAHKSIHRRIWHDCVAYSSGDYPHIYHMRIVSNTVLFFLFVCLLGYL